MPTKDLHYLRPRYLHVQRGLLILGLINQERRFLHLREY